ncbi:MAG TPA: class IV adenylate cyclase, partial [Isosphaeraceae bacterium]|nr:class IV adenylate cyclase [Isosphaeraceae bacterium]
MSAEHAGFEVEIKFRAADHRALAARLIALGAEASEAQEHEDLYLAHPSRDFARTDEALRLRRVGDQNRVTYKGPKLGGPTKTREEIEVPF